MDQQRTLINVADLIDPDTGESYRQGNLKKDWKIPLDSLVRVLRWVDRDSGYQDHPHAMVLRVTKRGRDCDGTPLYWLSHLTSTEYDNKMSLLEECVIETRDSYRWRGDALGSPALKGGYCDENLKVVALPHELTGDDA